MLVIFKSKATADLIMFEEHAKMILDLFHKEVAQGIITAEETATAIELLEAERNKRKEKDQQEQRSREQKEDAEKDKGDEHLITSQTTQNKTQPFISFATRTYPFLEMLQAAHKKKKDIVWGV